MANDKEINQGKRLVKWFKFGMKDGIQLFIHSLNECFQLEKDPFVFTLKGLVN